MKIGTVSESLEDYLLIIHYLIQETSRARVKDIAQQKGVKMSSVSSALKRLTINGLIDYTARDQVRLTNRGETLVKRLVNRRDQIRQFLHLVLGVPLEQASEDAGGMEHHVSLETLDRLAAFHGFLHDGSSNGADLIRRFMDHYNQCLQDRPSGAAGTSKGTMAPTEMEAPAERSLLDLKPGDRGVIKKILAQSAIRQRLIDMGFLPNVEVLMERVAPLGDPIEVKIKGFHLSLRNEEAARILIRESGGNRIS